MPVASATFAVATACVPCGGPIYSKGVPIPAANLKHLMLRRNVAAAVAAGQFRVHAVSTVEEAIELLTGITAGGAAKSPATRISL